MKTSDIIARVRSIAGDNDVLQFKDADVVSWINDAMRECASDNNLLQKKATQALTANQRGYALPVDILKLHSVQYNGIDLPILTLDQAQQQQLMDNSTGEPVKCWLWAGSVELYPTPTSSTDSIEINYTRSPVDVTGDADIPEIPAMYHMRLVDYCLAQVAQQDDDMQRYQIKMQEFKTGVQSLKDQPEWENNQYPFMGVSDRDMGMEFFAYYD